MPPWSSRLHPGPSTSSSNAAHSHVSAIPDAERTVPIPINDDVPILIPFDTPRPAASARRTHSRSISHPFPSLFGGSNKKNHKGVTKQDFLDSDDDDDFVTYKPDLRSNSPRKSSQRQGPAEDFLTGRCMTCDSTVRWPRDVKVFRCTVCLMVNDLEPYRDSGDAPHHGHPGRTETPAAKGLYRKAAPISVERTKRIVDQCVSSYLQRRLDILESRLSSSSINGQHFDTYPPSQTNGAHAAESPPDKWTLSPDAQLSSSPTQTSDISNYLSPPKEQAASRNGEGSNSLLSPYAADPEKRHLRRKNRSSSDIPAVPGRDRSPRGTGHSGNEASSKSQPDTRPLIFRPLEDYIISCFRGCECLNNSFSTARSSPRTGREGNMPRPKTDQSSTPNPLLDPAMFEPDAKTLLLGGIAENSTWWMGHRARRGDTKDVRRERSPDPSKLGVSPRTPHIDWAELAEWYRAVLSAGEFWREKWSMMTVGDTKSERRSSGSKRWDTMELDVIEKEIAEARLHAQRTLLKATESVLKRPRQPLNNKPDEIRFLLILLANPLLYSSASSRRPSSTAPSSSRTNAQQSRSRGRNACPRDRSPREGLSAPQKQRTNGPANHSGIIKRILGLMSNLPNDCHHCLVSWFSRFSKGQFQRIVDLIGGFVTYRLMRQHGRQRSESSKDDNALIPTLPGPIGNTAAQLHAALSGRNSSKQKKDDGPKPVVYGEDWQIKAAARVMSLLFAANNVNIPRKQDGVLADGRTSNAGLAARNNAHTSGQMIPISSFYNTLLDYSDLVADFEAWESRTGKFSFCQYPFFLSIWAKIHILEHDARRQMEVKAREAFFDSILSRKAVSQYLVLKVRRDCLIEDSLRSVSEVIGSNLEEVKKGLRIEFLGEEGVDAGGLRKEWFLLLVREIFDPNHGLFLYDEESQFCYFNPYCFESSEQFFLVGVLLGLAIYNSTILDVALPPFAFKKLLASAPPSNGPATSTARSTYKCSLEDLEQYRPSLAKGLRGLLEYDGDVQETFCHDFIAQVDRYGEFIEIPLCPGGERKPVTNSNRREFVDLYVHYMLDVAVARQFEPFKRGFFTVCGGNALSLFRPEEIELLVRGSEEALDVASLRAVATYDNWSNPRPEMEPVVQWFWELFTEADAKAQRKLLSFITGSDRIPAMGATNLTIRLACLGDDIQRYPTARTCFNMLGLYRYPTKQKLAAKIWNAVGNSEGFGLK